MCSPGAICFSGKVAAGEEFSKSLNAELVFELKRTERGWNIVMIPKRPQGVCPEWADIVNPPYRAHRELEIDMGYGWTAEDEVADSPRVFRFVTSCADYQTELKRFNIVLGGAEATPKEYDEAMAKLGTLALGKGRLWITGSRTDHEGDTPDDKLGEIEWISFTVEITLPRRNPPTR